MSAEQERRCRVIEEYQSSNPAPFSVHAGETFQISERVNLWNDNPAWVWIWCVDFRGRGGWVPKNAFAVSPGGLVGTAFFAYTAEELTVRVGDELLAYQEESGWIWCKTSDGRSGWVPAQSVVFAQ